MRERVAEDRLDTVEPHPKPGEGDLGPV